MAEEKRVSMKKVSGEQMAKGVYLATFTDGSTFSADLRELPGPDGQPIGDAYDQFPPMVQATLQYGLKQKLDDALAGVDDIEEAHAELNVRWGAIKAGKWTTRTAGEGGVEGGLFARAYAQFHGMSLTDAKTKIESIVDANLAKAQEREAAKPEKDRKEITERAIFNAVREVGFERYPDLKAIYDELKAKKGAKKSTANRPEIEGI
jgi:hypothetical protein